MSPGGGLPARNGERETPSGSQGGPHLEAVAELDVARGELLAHRWRAALHEAGHLVAHLVLTPPGHRLRRLIVRAVVDGAAGCVELVPPLADATAETLMTSAGLGAEALAAKHGPPASKADAERGAAPPTRLPWRSYFSPTDDREAVRSAASGPTDDRRIALWAVTGHESAPETWASRVADLRAEAVAIIAENKPAVLAAARRLFLDGSLVVESLEDLGG